MAHPQRPQIIVGMSGGVDSSVTALLLHQAGYRVSGLFMKNWEDNDPDYPCTAAEDAMDALAVCEQLDVPFDAVSFTDEYWERVFTHFLEEYRRGRTPNPDILCNKEIKFKAFLDYAIAQGAERIATGHYARIAHDGNRFRLLKAKDTNKDQTYFLYTLGQAQLAKALFPLGELTKPQVREQAEQANFPNHDKKDSTGICFIGERRFRPFLSRFLGNQEGNIVTPDGERLGRHQGLMLYTLGQRQGLGIGGRSDADSQPWYVVDKDLTHNTLIVGQGHDHPRLFSEALVATEMHWISGFAPSLPYRCAAKTRYRQADQPCTVTAIEGDTCHIRFDQPQRAVTPGQSVVLYQGEECLGGGVIDQRLQQV